MLCNTNDLVMAGSLSEDDEVNFSEATKVLRELLSREAHMVFCPSVV